MLKAKFAILLTALCLSVSGLANAEVLKVEAPVYVESVEVTEIEYSEVEFKNFATSHEYAVEVALDTLQQEPVHERRSNEVFIFVNEPLPAIGKAFEVGWRFSI